MSETTETLVRTVTSSTAKEVSNSNYKGYQLTFTAEKALGKLVSLTVTGYKQQGEGQADSITLNYNANTGMSSRPSISFTPVNSVNAELAAALYAEFELLNGESE